MGNEMNMTKEEFEKHWFRYFKQEEIDILKSMYDIEAIPCDCEESGCKGWIMKTQAAK